jgi:hypothetical protein
MLTHYQMSRKWCSDLGGGELYTPGILSHHDAKTTNFEPLHRICPGRFLADRIGFAFAATVLKAYSILPLEGEVLRHQFEYKDASTRSVISHYSTTSNHYS